MICREKKISLGEIKLFVRTREIEIAQKAMLYSEKKTRDMYWEEFERSKTMFR